MWKILKEMGIPDHITCLLRNLDGREVPVGTRHGTTDWFKIGKGFHQGCILSLCVFNLYATTKSESSCYELKKKNPVHYNSPIYSSSTDFINSKNIETYADSIPLITRLPWLVSHLWRLGRLGSQGWLVVGLRDPGGCGRQRAPMMFLECLLPSAGALSL